MYDWTGMREKAGKSIILKGKIAPPPWLPS
jgi:hypothetical protein